MSTLAILLQLGDADVELRDKHGRSAHDVASWAAQHGAVAVLRAHIAAMPSGDAGGGGALAVLSAEVAGAAARPGAAPEKGDKKKAKRGIGTGGGAPPSATPRSQEQAAAPSALAGAALARLALDSSEATDFIAENEDGGGGERLPSSASALWLAAA